MTIDQGVAQLFIDDEIIDRQSEGLVRTLHQPVKDYGGDLPIIAIDDEFGEEATTLEANGTIVFDPDLGKYVMFVLGFAPTMKGWNRTRLFRLTLSDGMEWTKGENGSLQTIFPRDEGFLQDAESGARARNIDLFSCCYDAGDPARPYKGWQWFSRWDKEGCDGIYYLSSKDGIYWERGERIVAARERVIEQEGRRMVGAGDVTTFYQDSDSGRYLAIIKFTTPAAVEHGSRLRARAYRWVDRLDLPADLDGIEHIELLPSAARRNGDYPHDEYYASTAWRYQSVWLGGLKIWHGGGDHPWSAAGSAYLKLVVSRDGLCWDRVNFKNENGIPGVWLPNGPEGGNGGRNDGGYGTSPNSARGHCGSARN